MQKFEIRTKSVHEDPIHLFGDFHVCKKLIRERTRNTEEIKKQLWQKSSILQKFASEVQGKIGRDQVFN